MEPASALAVAFKAVKVVRFCKDVVQLERTISRDGSPDASLAEKSAQLSAISGDLEASLTTYEKSHLTKQ